MKRKPRIVTETLPNSDVIVSCTDSLLGVHSLVIGKGMDLNPEPIILNMIQIRALAKLIVDNFPEVLP